MTFALDRVKLSTVHRKKRKEKGKGKNVNRKTPRDPRTQPSTRDEEPTVQLCGDSEVASRWFDGQVNIRWDKSTEDELAKLKKLCTHSGKETLPTLFRRLMTT